MHIIIIFFLKSKSSSEAMSKERHLYQFDMKLHYLDYSFFLAYSAETTETTKCVEPLLKT